MPAPIDLHIHTTSSDGRYPPEVIVRQAARLGMTTLAFTDHDNTRGYQAALPLARKFGIELIPAIEFTCRWPHCDIVLEDDDTDLLGYFMEVDHPAFRAFEQAALRDVFDRMSERCAAVTALGYPITLQDVLAENPDYPGGIHLGMALEHLGYACNWNAALTILDQSRNDLRSGSFTIYQAIEYIHRAGGIAILAHPTTLTGRTGHFEPEHLATLVEMGLDGLEVYHPRVDDAARAHLIELAHHFHLVVSGGSDLHGWKGGLNQLGSQPITAEALDALRHRHRVRTA